MRYAIILLFTACCFTVLVGQTDYDTGYLVLENGDTLHGEVQDRKAVFSGVEHLNRIRYRSPEGKTKRYSRSYILAYRTGDRHYRKYRLEALRRLSILTNYYQLVPYGGEVEFLRVLHEGPLSHFEMEWTEDMSNYIETFPLFLLEGQNIMIRATQGIFGLKRKILIDYFSGCPALQRELSAGSFSLPFEVLQYYEAHCGERP